MSSITSALRPPFLQSNFRGLEEQEPNYPDPWFAPFSSGISGIVSSRVKFRRMTKREHECSIIVLLVSITVAVAQQRLYN